MNEAQDTQRDDIHFKSTRIGHIANFNKSIVPALEAYEIKQEVGRGGMAVVYEAVEKSLNRVVALKVLDKELSQETDLINRFVHEAQAAARVTHPNIVQVYSIGQERQVYYFAMEYIRGTSVEQLLNKGKKISYATALNIIKDTVLALREAYKNNIVHHDIKPGNLLLTEQGIVKVTDFGLAADIKGASPSSGGKIIGTPLYISPEQAQGKEGDHRSDIYSLGITFYQMLAGKVPFISSDTKVLMKSHIEKPIPPLNKDVPLFLKKLVYRMTEKNIEKRFQDYESLIKEIDRVYKKLTRKRYVMPFLLISAITVLGLSIYSFYYKPKISELMLATEIEKGKRIEGIYKNVVEYAKQHPESYGDIIKEYFSIIRDYPNTEWAYRAEQKIDMIILAVAKGAADELKDLKSVRDKLINEHLYKEAIDKYQSIRDKYNGTVAESFAQENINYIKEEAKRYFQSLDEQAKAYLNQYDFTNARKLYEKVINTFGLPEFVNEAKDKLRFIDELEKGYKIEAEAKSIFDPVAKEVNKLLQDNNYEEARKHLAAIDLKNENPVLSELVKNETNKINEMQLEHDSSVLKEKLDTKYNQYNEINNKVAICVENYKYKEALDIVKQGITNVEIVEWRRKLELLKEKLIYLLALKNTIITEINKELIQNKMTNIQADDDTVIFVVSGGYVGVPWKEASAQKIYQVAKAYLKGSPDEHIDLGVFCLTYGLYDDARKEFATLLKREPQKQDVIEKYITELAESDKAH